MAHAATSSLSVKLNPALTGSEAEDLGRGLEKRIVGQREAIDQIVNVYQTYLAALNSPGRPVGNFLFLGPTGTGKTRVVEAMAEVLTGDPRAVIKIDCGEFQHSHEIAKLIGSPPGYLGHRETHPLLSQEALNQHHTEKTQLSFVLFDEIEKASDALWNLLLGILDKATLTLGDNRRVDFSKALIFMTSNLGASEIDSVVSPGLGFSGPSREDPRSEHVGRRISKAGFAAARKKFTPEFMNRLDKIVVFKPLGTAELSAILDLELAQVQQRIFSGTPFLFQLSARAKDLLLEEGTDAKYGARHLKRAIERRLVYPMANLIATRQVRSGDMVKIDVDRRKQELTFHRVQEGVPVYAMVKHAGLALPEGVEATAAAQSAEHSASTQAQGNSRK